MDSQELLKETEDAKAAMEEAEAEYKESKEALGKWKQENPGFALEDKWFLYHQKKVDECYDALKVNKEIYNNLIKTFHDLVKKMPSVGITTAELKELITQNKQLIQIIKSNHMIDWEQSSNDTSKTSSQGRNRTHHNNFREKLKARDKVCVISGEETGVEACHIIPYDFPFENSGIWSLKYNQFCFNQDDGTCDVRNGILLSKSFYNRFKEYQFTIVFEENLYKIRVGGIPITGLENGMVLSFPTDMDSNGNEWKDQWPAPEFLAWHNDNFEFKLKASTDPLLF